MAAHEGGGGGGKPRTLLLTRAEVQLKEGMWSTEVRWGYSEHMEVALHRYDEPQPTLSLDQASQPDKHNTLRLAFEGLEERDLVALVLRFCIAQHCLAAVHRTRSP